MPDLHATFSSLGSIPFICWLFSRWEVVQASLTSEKQPCFLPADDLEHRPHQLGRDGSVCAFGQASRMQTEAEDSTGEIPAWWQGKSKTG